MIKAVIFDVDGTLVDTVEFHAEAWVRTFRDHGYEVSLADARWQIGKGGDLLMPIFLPKEVVEAKGEAMEAERSAMLKRDYMPRIAAFPEVRELFERIRADGTRIVLGSSAKKDELDYYVQVANIGDLLEAATTSEDAEKSKPHPDIFHAALDQLGDVAPSEAIVVGDSPYDAEAAVKAGIRCVGLLSGKFPEDALRRSGCIAVYRDPAHLLAEYDRSPLAGR